MTRDEWLRLTPEGRIEYRKGLSREAWAAFKAGLTPAERVAFRKERWRAQVDAGDIGPRLRASSIDPDLAVLKLEVMPATLDELKRALHKILFRVHPDHGGSDEATQTVLAAFNRLKESYSA